MINRTPYRVSIRKALILCGWLVLVGFAGNVLAQRPVHYFQRGDMPPGAIGKGQLVRGGPLAGHFQPVEIRVPENVQVALGVDGGFADPKTTSVKAGMLIGEVYSLRVTNIPLHEGREVFPTIEVINRLYPPKGMELKFPIPVHLTQEELVLALRGQFVTRVIYLEDGSQPVPVQDGPDFQRYHEVHPSEDPLQVADRLGRPVAVLRMGSRVPISHNVNESFPYKAAPLLQYEVSEDGRYQITQVKAIKEEIPKLPASALRRPLPSMSQAMTKRYYR